MSCSNNMPPPDFYCNIQPPKISQEELRRHYGLPNTALDISVSHQPPKAIRMPFGLMESPAESWLRWRTVEGRAHERRLC